MRHVVVLLAALAVVVAGCSSPSDAIAGKILDNVDGVSNVDLNSDTGQIKFDTPDGSISFGGGDVPSNLFVTLPGGYEIQTVIETDDGAVVSVAYDQGRYDELVSYFSDWTSSDSSDWEHSSYNSEQDGTTLRSDSWNMSDQVIHLSDCHSMESTGDTPDAACVMASSG